MKKALFIITSAALLMSAAGCQHDSLFKTPSAQEITEIRALNGDSGSRTQLDSDETSILWSPNDSISVFFNSIGIKFTALNSSPVSWTVFQSEKALIFGGDNGTQKPYIYGIYPYSEDNAQSDGTLTLNVPHEQLVEAGSFAEGCFPSVGRSTNTDIAFYNVCGGIRFTVSQDSVYMISFKGNGGEYLAGKVNVVFDDNGLPYVNDIRKGETRVMAGRGDGFEPGKWYYMSMLPGKLSNGFTVKIYKYDTGYTEATLNVSSAREIKRAIFGELPNIDNGLTFKQGISDIKLNVSELTLAPGETAQLSYTIYPSDASYDWIQWGSDDETIAAVDGNGNVTMLKNGTCHIYCRTDNYMYGFCQVSSDFNMSISSSKLAFAAAEGLSQTMTVTSPYDWTIDNAPDWASFDVSGKDPTKETIKASSDPVTITVTVQENTGISRNQIVKVNGTTESFDLTIQQDGVSTDKTISEFITLADTQNNYKLTGTVSNFNSSYCSFDLTDATGTIYVYSVISSSKTQYASVIKDGDTVSLSGKYSYYSSKSQHEVIQAEILEHKTGKHQIIETENVSDVMGAASADSIILNNALVVAASKTAYLVTDANQSDYILVFYGSDIDIKVGDKVKVNATRGAFCNMPQLINPTTNVISSGNSVTYPSPEDITSTFDSFTSTNVKYISFTGTLNQVGTYYNISVNGATTNVGSILSTDAITSLIGVADTTFTGYYLYTSGGKYINIIFVE